MDVFIDEKKPEVLSATTMGVAIAIHIGLFLVAFFVAKVHFRSKETVIPIDLTVVVNENLDGEENEPPPLNDPPPPTPPTPAPTQPKVVTPPPLVDDKIDAVIKEKEKPKEKVKTKAELEKERLEKIRQRAQKLPDKPKEKPQEKPKEPQKTKEQILQERIEKMRSKTTKPVNIKVNNQPSGNGRTEKQTRSEQDIRKMLDQGYKPGAKTVVAADEKQRCISLIQRAFYEKWDSPPWTDTLKTMRLSVQIGSGGRILGYRLVQSSGDAKADQTVLAAAAKVRIVSGLSESFIASEGKDVIINFKVRPQ